MRKWTALLACLMASAALPSAADPAGVRAPELSAVPPRPADGMGGAAFATLTEGWPERERQRAALRELEGGNLPRSLRKLVPVELQYQPAAGHPIRATIWVTPDYLAVGGDDDFLYLPLTRGSAAEVARRFGCLLPTPKMVDAIYREAGAQLEPRPLPAGPAMRSSAYCERHQRMIDVQRAGIAPGTLVSGHKKDLVLSDRLLGRPDRVAIYGWHRRNGQPIQPLSTWHGVNYADYSHGVRLVWHEVWIDGSPRSLDDVLEDPDLAPVLSDEGVIRDPRGLLDSSRGSR